MTHLLARGMRRALHAYRTRRTLDDLPDEFLTDIGLTRSDIGFAAGAIASGRQDPTRDPLHPLNRSVVAG